MFLTLRLNKSTIRPIKNVPNDHRGYDTFRSIKGTLGGMGATAESVDPPPGQDVNDWIAMNLIEFYNQLNMFFTAISDECTQESCPKMCSGPNYVYLWQDEDQYKKPTELPAKQYILLLFDWADEQLSDRKVFPIQSSTPYPSGFKKTAGKIYRRLFRIYCHLYYHHLKDFKENGGIHYLNASLKHFYRFVKRHDLVGDNELTPLIDVIKQL